MTMSYVDGFVLPVPTKNLDRYREMATIAGKTWMKHGALQYVETVAQDTTQHEFGLPFTKAFDVRPEETAVFAYIVYKNREHRDEVNKKVMDDPAMKAMGDTYADVFDCNRMAYTGFETIVEM